MASALSLSNITDEKIKWPLALVAFFIGLIIGLLWFLHFRKNRLIYKAVKDLSMIFQSDVSKLEK